MGIQGLLTFITKNDFLEECHLQNTTLVIDGMNLEYELYRRYLERWRDDRAFGGDYNHYGVFIGAFFQQLLDCKVTPVVILDGSFKLTKLPTKRERFDKQLQAVKAIYFGDHTAGADIVPLMSSYLFVQVIKRMKIAVYKTIFEADDVIPRIAADLYAPILSADSDFLLCNLPAGIVHMKRLMEGELTVQVEADTGEKYLPCHLYRVAFLNRRYPKLTPELIHAAGVLLGNDHLSRDESKGIRQHMPPPVDSDAACNQGSFRQAEIDKVFSWLSNDMGSVQEVKETILTNVWAKSHVCVPLVKTPKLEPRTGPPPFPLNVYFERNKDSLFKADSYFRADNSGFNKRNGGAGPMNKPRSGGYPKWAFDNLVKEVIPRRMISIYSVQVEFLRPLVEDFSLEHSSYETVFELCRYIYGLLRSEDTNPIHIKRYVRVEDRRYDVKVEPACYLPKTQLDYNRAKLVPKLEGIELMLKPDLPYYFFLILDFDSNILNEVKRTCLLNSSGISVDHLPQFRTLILALIYFSRHFSYAISMEFYFALFANIMLIGHLDDGCDNGAASDGKSLCLPIFKLSSEEQKKLTKKLEPFLEAVPNFVENAYQPRIVHQYNAYQNCLSNIIFLATILRLEKEYHVDSLISGLQGTFIYSLTVALTFEREPLAYLEELILRDHGFSKHLKLFRELLDLTLKYSGRRYVTYKLDNCTDRSVLPLVVPRCDAEEGGEERNLFVHSRSHWVLQPMQQVSQSPENLASDNYNWQEEPITDERFCWSAQPHESETRESENYESKNSIDSASNQYLEHDYLVNTLD